MLIIEVMGGLGNQLQQYALYQKMKNLGKEAKLDISWFTDTKKQKSVLAARRLDLLYFENLPMEICTEAEKEALIGSDTLSGKVKRRIFPKTDRHFYESGIYHPEIFTFEDRYLTGFWACEKYYVDILPLLRKLIIFPEIDCCQNSLKCQIKEEELSKKQNCANSVNIQTILKEQGCNGKSEKIQNKEIVEQNIQIIGRMKQQLSVSVHIRRGDYLDPENAAMFGGICTEPYYDGAMAYILRRCPDAHFYIFSDDIPYVKEKYRGPQYTVVDWNTGENSFYDIRLMSSCRHNICANSTFSFWGARLNPNPDKIMIRPAKHKNSQQIIPEELHELWDNWVIIDGEGRIV